MASSGLTFGIYPLSTAGTPVGLAVGPQDNYEKIKYSLHDLSGKNKTLLPRNYVVYTGPESESKWLAILEHYLQAGLLGDLTVGCMQEQELQINSWLGFIQKIVSQYGSDLVSLQITNEPNLTFMEGSKPYVLQALVEGVLTAKNEIRNRGLPTKIGFGSVPDGPMAIPNFWRNLAEAGGSTFINSVDYVGHNFYVDVFEEQPLDLEEIPACIELKLRNLREKDLITAGIPDSVPIHVTENGWPTGKNPFNDGERSYEQQAKILEKIIRTIYNLRLELNISHYELFGLRDADSSEEDLFHQFGIMRDDYSPKPAFSTFKSLIHELGV